MTEALNTTITTQIFDYLGMQLAADMATHMTSLKLQFPVDEIDNYSKLTYA